MSFGFEKLRVLLVDDNWHMRSIAMTLLGSFGVSEIRDVDNGADAVVVAQTWAPDIALVDFKMEPMNGIEFTRIIRTSPLSTNPFLPIIMMSGHSAAARVMEARDAGVTDFIVKPLKARTLISRLNSAVYQPRAFVRTKTYFGPDRRRGADPAHEGPWRRFDDCDLQPASYDTSASTGTDENLG
jgi:CheY-like chemotaxis protein